MRLSVRSSEPAKPHEFRRLDFRVQGGVARIAFDDPSRRNALTEAMLDDIEAAFDVIDDLSARRALRAVLLEGCGGFFCSGYDVARIDDDAADPNTVPRMREENLRFGRLLHRLSRIDGPVLAVVDGSALGAGMGLLGLSDVVLATAQSHFALLEPVMGLLPVQSLPYLAQRIGPSQLRRLALSAEVIDAAEAARIGLVHRVLPDADHLAAGRDRLVEDVLRCGPQAIATVKRTLRQLLPYHDHAVQAAAAFASALASEEGREGTTAFRSGREPAWAASAPDWGDAPASDDAPDERTSGTTTAAATAAD